MTEIEIPRFVEGAIYKRSKIHDQFGGIRQTGIAPSNKSPAIFIFTGESGKQYGYSDSWDASGQVFTYTGEGTKGDMSMSGGNLAIRDHITAGRTLHLFEIVPPREMKGIEVGVSRKGYCRYIGEMQLAFPVWGEGLDVNGLRRKILKFELVRVSGLGDAFGQELAGEGGTGVGTVPADQPQVVPLAVLRERAFRAAKTPAGRNADARRTIYERSQEVVRYALARAAGCCECCAVAAPFLRRDGSPYLEVHHVDRVSDGGLDAPEKVAAICPTCHRRIHHGCDGSAVNFTLKERVLAIEASLGPQHK